MFFGSEGPVNSGGGNLQRVSPGKRISNLKVRTYFAAERSALANGDSTGPVYQKAQAQPAEFRP